MFQAMEGTKASQKPAFSFVLAGVWTYRWNPFALTRYPFPFVAILILQQVRLRSLGEGDALVGIEVLGARGEWRAVRCCHGDDGDSCQVLRAETEL